eukprot:g4557.t1
MSLDRRLFIFTHECFETYFKEFDFLDEACFKSTLSTGLSFAVILGSVILKLPQILNILRSKSVEGLAPASLYMDVLAFVPVPTYAILRGNAFMTYGEGLIVIVQNMLIVLLLWQYSKNPPSWLTRLFYAFAFVGIVYAAFHLPEEFWPLLPGAATTLAICSRIPQIFANFRNGHTGQLALLTWLLNFVGAGARVFTSWQETKDLNLVISYSLPAVCSLVIILQIFCFWSATAKANAKVKGD